ncbi:transglutaminase family protein [Alkalicaulis satelles]|uniref:Transglutaminase family protein n=1 Tax=Alkalicaulis satelles TaxID=2609175 RepID=A0A5M6ZCT8_9PROT|nr:transglutaminase family protein [Alkalicaulis satelles]KAA5801647.1 transglutaminase family protein [Alkalicaulis satelles]
MLIRVEHQTTYRYDRAPRLVIQALRKTPRSCASQHVRRWRINADADVRIHQSEDAFGNIMHALYTDGPVEALSVTVSGEVETSDTAGALEGWPERQPELVFLRTTPLTEPGEAIRSFADPLRRKDRLDLLHGLMSSIHAQIAFDAGATDVSHSAQEAFELGRGVCQDHTHIFLAAARWLGVPARYVSGHLRRRDGEAGQEAAHAWAEAKVEGLGWVGFDAANGVCPDANYVRVASALDYLGAAPVRGASYGGQGERLSVSLQVDSPPAASPPPSQLQQ